MKVATRKRKNSGLSQAAAISEAFHQRPATKLTEVLETHAERQDFAELGRLKELQVLHRRTVYKLPFPRPPLVLTDPDGRNLYLKGGDQALDLDSIGIAAKDLVAIAPVVSITYHTKKGFHQFEPIDYTHAFGDEGGAQPTLLYDTLNRELYIAGGSYQVKPEGIVN
jgi:hypothetical protein